MNNGTILAYAYGSGPYGASTYATSGTTASTGSTSAPPSATPGASSGSLTNTGFDIAIVVTLACLITLTALAVRVWKRPSPKTDH